MAETEREIPQLTYSFAREYGFALTSVEAVDSRKAVAVCRVGADMSLLREVRRVAGMPLRVEQQSARDFDTLLSTLYAADSIDSSLEDTLSVDSLDSALEGMPKAADLLANEDDAPVIRLINSLMAEAVKSKASDVHLEPFEKHLSVRLRVDGVLAEVASLSARLTPYIVSRIKVMARLDIAEKRIPQDGRLSLSFGERGFDVRVSTLPARHGERVVLRILDTSQALLSLESLGMQRETHQGVEAALTEPNGIILVTGPTGSGKTTTLYAGLSLLNDRSRNIMTVEDPIEYALEGISQTQVNTKVGMSFANGLRAILRQDPDIVMVGEIRDMETAEIAVQASLTGHLVLSTVHTNGAVAAITRLRDMGIEPFLLASTVKAILAQRLVRKLCGACKQPLPETPELRDRLAISSEETVHFFQPAGCQACNDTGYQGRIGIYELVRIDTALRRLIQEGASEQDLESAAHKQNETLAASGARLVASGMTTVEEILRVSKLGTDC